MDGIFIEREGGGFGVTLVRALREMPMDWFPHENKARDYAKRMAANQEPAAPVYLRLY